MKLWQKDYKLDKEIEKFTVGDDYFLDRKLLKYDCLASIAHAKMLCKIKILTESECKKIVKVIDEIMNDEKFVILPEDEDCHTAIENFLVKKLGSTGKKIHTARSRNDQVLTALRLYYKFELAEVVKLIDAFVGSLKQFNSKYGKVKMPGYTHMRKAMPSSVGLWSGCFVESMLDNKELLLMINKLIDQSPLGTGAGYGLPLKVDRQLTAKLLGFSKIQNNPIYVQNSRGKFECSVLHALSQVMFDLNKISSDILLFSMPEFGYFELPSEFCTGSSIMPHKKNPDVLELVRAKYHKVVSAEFEVKGVISNLISGYNRDLQLTKKPVMESFDAVKSCLHIMKLVFGKLKVDSNYCQKAMTAELYSVEKALELVKKDVPFREAYKSISRNI